MQSNQTSVTLDEALSNKLLGFVLRIQDIHNSDFVPSERRNFQALENAIDFLNNKASPNLLENLQIVHGILNNKPSSAEITTLITTCEELILEIEDLRKSLVERQAIIMELKELYIKIANQNVADQAVLERRQKEVDDEIEKLKKIGTSFHNADEREQQIIQAPEGVLSWVRRQIAEKVTQAKNSCSIF